MIVNNYKLDIDSNQKMITYLTFTDLFNYILINKSCFTLYKNFKKGIMYNFILRSGYSIKSYTDQILIKKPTRAITIDKNTMFDEKILLLINENNSINSSL